MNKQLIAVTLDEFTAAFFNGLKPIFEQFLEQQSTQPPPLPDTMTQQEVMKHLRVSKQTLINYRRQGLITGHVIKGTRRVYYLRSEIEKLFQAQKS